MLTTDEAYFAGGYDSSNATYYLYTGNYYWTMSPFYFNSSESAARVWRVYSAGDLSSNFVTVSIGVRPVINLKSGSLSKGSGTADDPYMI